MKNQQTKLKNQEPRKPQAEPPPPSISRVAEPLPFINLRWFVSSTVRKACQMQKHVNKLVSAQRDILSPQAIASMEAAAFELRKAIATQTSSKALLNEMTNLEEAANKWLKPYPNAGLRENVEVLLVAIAVAMAIRTFFLQPFKIPTGSMQPTLYGITPSVNGLPPGENVNVPPQVQFPNWFVQFFSFWFNGVQYKEVLAKADGIAEINDGPLFHIIPNRFLLFNLQQSFRINGVRHIVWFPPDDLWKRAGIDEFSSPKQYKKGQPVIRLITVSGDHLFVDRLTYNFRRPTRGDIIVFETGGIEGMDRRQWGQFYIKRLVALGGEHVRIGDDRRLIINNTNKLSATTPHFENVYSQAALSRPPQDSQYSGHVNGTLARQYSAANLAPLFPDENHEFAVRPEHYMVMGDNTMNSSDSRTWGDFSKNKVIGRGSSSIGRWGRKMSGRAGLGGGIGKLRLG